MIGQQNILKKIDSYTLTTLPKTLLFIGENGSEEDALCNYIATKFNLHEVEVTENTTSEELLEYRQSPVSQLIKINLTDFDEYQQNKLLKFIEEPNNTTNLVLFGESENIIIDTILNRCAKVYLEPYTTEQLKKVGVFKNSLVYNIFATPGQLANLDDQQFEFLLKNCTLFFDNYSKLTYVQCLNFANMINYKDAYTKLNFTAVIKILKYLAAQEYKLKNTENAFILYNKLLKVEKMLIYKSINRETLMLSFLADLKKE